ncbi:MAG: phosphoglucosamine mutase [Candidatus Baltobacteraceae bacterium]|jgi:phosphoglucosamine mutase
MSAPRLFGTDGVRGVANLDLTPELAFRIGRAGAVVLARESGPERPVVIGRDTRLSGTMLEAALVAGITSVGRDTLSLGVVPTPGVACITARLEAAAGVMISASHNPIEDNGVKFFGADGFKLRDEQEREIERILDDESVIPRATHGHVGIARSAHGLVDRYFTTLLEAGGDLSSLTVAVDAAFGAAFDIGPRALARLGAEVVPLHAEDDGSRINVACGSTDLSALAERVRALQEADPSAHVLGVAFDGDADRVLFVDERGAPVSGDHVMLILGRERKRLGHLPGDTVVGTVMSNAGLERALAREGIKLLRTAVGDRYVLEAMRAEGYTFGGEQSGHIIDLDRNTTGDGPMAAVALLSIVAAQRTTLHELAAALHVYPQVLVNVRTARKHVLDDAAVRAAIARVEAELGAEGRLLVRASGTEPLIRVMIEGDDRARIVALADELAQVVRGAAS